MARARRSRGTLFAEDGEPARRERRPTRAPRPTPAEAASRFRSAAEKGLLKILSKMGISTLSSYCGAQIFEVLGLGHEVVSDLLRRHGVADRRHRVRGDRGGRARAASRGLRGGGGGDGHLARLRPGALPQGRRGPRLGAADRRGAPAGGEERSGAEAYGGFLAKNSARRPAGPRDLLGGAARARRCRSTRSSPRSRIRRRFVSSAMSLGALSPEAHATLSIAMNRMGARSNSGEGGEDPHNYVTASPTATGRTTGSSRWPPRGSA